MPFSATMKLEGMDELRNSLRELGSTKARAAMRRAVQEASTPVLRAARALVPIDSKQLRKSLGRRVKTYRSSGVTVVIIGPRVGFKADVIDSRGRRVLRNPEKYAHLVEYGHRIALGGTLQRKGPKVLGKPAPKRQGSVGGTVAPRAFLLPALNTNRDNCIGIIRRHLESVLLRAAGGG